MLAYLNANPGASILLTGLMLAIVLGVLIALIVRALGHSLTTRMADVERYRRRQHADLIERIEASNNRMNHDLQLVNQLMTLNAQAGEERMERMLERLQIALEQQQRNMRELRESVDEKLQQTLEQRLGESFRQVSQQLERVHKGLGDMQRLAAGVGDLKRVLAGVKTRGIWGEVKLKALLEQILTPEQYLENTPVEPNGTERVEFAVALPGKGAGVPVLLPIDAKFPQEDYQRLLDAAEAGDKNAEAAASQALERALIEEAKRIATKYIRVPHTTDFAILFLPVEGLFAEALRRPGLVERIQDKHRVILSGPTTLSALLNALQMGFQTLAVEQRSEEIWRLLGVVRGEFTKFGEVLDRTRQRIEQAGAELDAASTRTRQITRQLNRVDGLSVPDEWKQGG